MMMSAKRLKIRRCTVAVLGALACIGAQAGQFETENGWRGSVTTTVSLGASWRMEAPNSMLYSKADGARAGYSVVGTGATNTDSGTLNWDKGDRFATPLKAVLDFSMQKDAMGLFMRGKTWYDQALNHESVRAGNGDSNYAINRPLSDTSQPRLNKFKGLELLDAYVYNTIEVGGKDLQLRAGKQVVNWGESLFVQGVNQLNPIDVPALRKPGTEVKEALLPVWSLYGNLGLGGGVSVEGFYQLRWAPHVIDSCGGYWAPIESSFTTRRGTGCSRIATTLPGFSNFDSTNGTSMLAGGANGRYLEFSDGRDGSHSGQFGLALRLPLAAIDAEIGLYAMQINSRAPFVSGRLGYALSPVRPPVVGLSPAVYPAPASGIWEYPDRINIYAASLSTNLSGWSVGAEVSHTPNQPVQVNGNDLLAGFLYGVGPMGATSKALFAASGVGTAVPGYDRMAKSQLQANTIKVLPGMLGASQGLLFAEAGAQWLRLPDNGRRYGRGFIFGNGSDPTYAGLGPAAPGGNTCGAVNPQVDGCRNDGYFTKFAWGYRVRASFDYQNAFDSGVTLSPSLFFGHDVTGYSSDSQFVKGRKVVTMGLKADFQKKFTADFSYTTFANSAKFDGSRDRDYLSAAISYTF